MSLPTSPWTLHIVQRNILYNKANPIISADSPQLYYFDDFIKLKFIEFYFMLGTMLRCFTKIFYLIWLNQNSILKTLLEWTPKVKIVFVYWWVILNWQFQCKLLLKSWSISFFTLSAYPYWMPLANKEDCQHLSLLAGITVMQGQGINDFSKAEEGHLTQAWVRVGWEGCRTW